MTIAPTSTHGRRERHPHRILLVVILALGAVGLVLLVRHDDTTSSNSTTRGSGVAAAQTRSLARFDAVELAGSSAVTIRVGARQSVVVHADDNLLTRVTTSVDAGRLVIGNTPGSFSTKSPMRVEIGVPSLAAVTLSGSGVISVNGVRAPRLTLVLGGSGIVLATGVVTRLDVTLAGSGDAQLAQLVAREVHAKLSGSGRVLVTATRSLAASVPGSGAIVYSGHPATVTTSVTGSGAVVPA